MDPSSRISVDMSSPDFDLIDFDLRSLEPISTISEERNEPPLESDNNLLDTEWPVFERNLQTAPSKNVSSKHESESDENRDVVETLIDLDETDGLCKKDVLDLRNVCSTSGTVTSNSDDLELQMLNFTNNFIDSDDSSSYTSQEALNILSQLDEVLEASLLNYLSLDDFPQDDGSIEDCLKDLDNYLGSFEFDTSTEDADNVSLSSPKTSKFQSLRNIPESLVASLPKLQRHVHNKSESELRLRPVVSSSQCLASSEDSPRLVALSRNDQRRATIAAIRRSVARQRTGDGGISGEVETVLHTGAPGGAGVSIGRTSGAATSAIMSTTASEEASHNNTHESTQAGVENTSVGIEAHMETTATTTTTTRRSITGASASPVSILRHSQDDNTVVTSRPPTTTWLRNSMRRLRHIQLPDDDSDPPANTMTIASPGVSDGQLGLVQRPVSAPSRLARRDLDHLDDGEDESVMVVGTRARSNSSVSSRDEGGSGNRRVRGEDVSGLSSSSVSSSLGSSSAGDSTVTAPSVRTTPVQGLEDGETDDPRVLPGEVLNADGVNRRPCDRSGRPTDMPEASSPLGQWPHSLSSMLACLGCTLGIFNISRFAILSIHFGANFILQFFLLSLVIGIPLFTLQLCLGQQLGAGVVDMWRISPMFQGVGISLLFFQALVGLYSITGIAWMFVYFRDAFITRVDRYKWAEPFLRYHRNDSSPYFNEDAFPLSQTVPDYLSGVVLQRYHLPNNNEGPNTSSTTYNATIRFQPAFNLAVVWLIIFVALSKGLRSYGKVVYVCTLLPVAGICVLAAKMIGLMPDVNEIFPETTWNEFFVNSKSWLAASQEVFLTWGLLSAAVMQIASHNKNKFLLQRDSSLIAVITFTILLLVAFLANTCVQILRANGYSYLPNSFEKMSTYNFLRHKTDPLPPNLASTPIKYMVHNSFILGERVTRPGANFPNESGYQVLRFATELVPATFAVLGTEKVSPFWAVLFYFTLILFGIAQQLAIWHSVITGIMAIKATVLKSWETTITFFSCACGFLLGLPMTTELGIYFVYFMDITIGGVWWLILVILLQILAVFMVRGRPYSGDTVVTALFNTNSHPCWSGWAPTLLSFTWNVVLPVVLLVWCIAFFKNGNFRELFIWHHAPSLEYWPLWTRQIGSLLQLLPVLAVPFIAVVQSYRYLNNGPPDILDRIQLLYRPPLGEHMEDIARTAAAANPNTTAATGATVTAASHGDTILAEDPPPKYTPPPSYTTATGAKLARLLRQSFRRSVRRLASSVLGAGTSGEGTSRQRGGAVSGMEEGSLPPPPDYHAVLVEMNARQRDLTDGTLTPIQRELAAAGRPVVGLTAADVASILRSSFRRSTVRSRANTPQTSTPVRNTTTTTTTTTSSSTSSSGNNAAIATASDSSATSHLTSLSAENLVDAAAPIGETSLVLTNNHSGDSDSDIKVEEDGRYVSVI